MPSFEELIDGLPPVFRKGVSLLKKLWSGDATRELTVKDLTATDVTANKVTVGSVQFDTAASTTLEQGGMQWNPIEETWDCKSNDAVGQMFLEDWFHVKNNTLATLRDGRPMMAAGTDGVVIYAAPMDGTNTANALTMGGLATSDILPGGVGKVTSRGNVRDIDTTGGESFGGLETWNNNDILYVDPVNVGYLTNVEPVPPAMYLPVCLVQYAHATLGNLLVRVTPLDQAVLRTSSMALTYNSPLPERNAQENIFGNLHVETTANDVNAGDVTLTADTDWGLGKMVIVSNGVGETGTVTITGTTVDRDTGVETPLGVSTIVVDTTTTDANGTDANSQPIYSLTDAYITDKWFDGTANIVISQTAGSLTDLDIYACSFNQFGDVRSINLKSFDVTVFCSTGDAATKFSLHAYTVRVTGDKVNILPGGAGIVRTGDLVTDKWYRFRRGELDIQLDGTTDGLFANVSFLGTPAKFKDATVQIWADIIP